MRFLILAAALCSGCMAADAITKPEWADASGTDQFGTWATLKIGAEVQKLRYIPGGTFTINAWTSDKRMDKTCEVTLSPYWIGDSEVTIGLWNAVGHNPKKGKLDPQIAAGGISWNDASAFCSRLVARFRNLTARLPTEAEWEYACLAGGAPPTKETIDRYAWYDRNSGQNAHAVCTKEPNAWGLYDMLGNRAEWARDWCDYTYPDQPVRNPTGPEKANAKAWRGGYFSGPLELSNPSIRHADTPNSGSVIFGFRFVAVIPDEG